VICFDIGSYIVYNKLSVINDLTAPYQVHIINSNLQRTTTANGSPYYTKCSLMMKCLQWPWMIGWILTTFWKLCQRRRFQHYNL